MSRLWTDKEDEYLLAHAQLSAEQLASELGRSPIAVRRRLRKKREGYAHAEHANTAETFVNARAARQKAVKARAPSKTVSVRTLPVNGQLYPWVRHDAGADVFIYPAGSTAGLDGWRNEFSLRL